MNLAETSCCSYLDVFKLFYRQSTSHQHRHGASRETSGSFGATFSDDSGPPDAPVSVFVVFGTPRQFGSTSKWLEELASESNTIQAQEDISVSRKIAGNINVKLYIRL